MQFFSLSHEKEKMEKKIKKITIKLTFNQTNLKAQEERKKRAFFSAFRFRGVQHLEIKTSYYQQVTIKYRIL
jgi:hypothetical protein